MSSNFKLQHSKGHLGELDQHGEGASVTSRLKLLLCSQSSSLARQGGDLKGDTYCSVNFHVTVTWIMTITLVTRLVDFSSECMIS